MAHRRRAVAGRDRRGPRRRWSRPAGGDRFGSWEPPNLRRMLVDLHDEYARHVGHADLFREAIDGLVGEDPPQD